jgi:hypothetical protein
MDIKQVFKVVGAKGFKGSVEGQNFDSTKLYVLMPVSDRAGTEAGFNVSQVPFGKEEEFQKIKALKWPVDAELTISMTTKGMECVGFELARAAAPKPV